MKEELACSSCQLADRLRGLLQPPAVSTMLKTVLELLHGRQKKKQVAQLLQRDRATHELLRFPKLRSAIFDSPFGGLRGKVGALSMARWKARDRLPMSDK